MTEEEKALGLDPSKFTKRPWSPQNYFGYSENNPQVMKRIADEMRLKAEQEKYLQPEPYISPEERMKNQKQILMKNMRTVTPEQIAEIDRRFYALPENQELIQRLAIEMKNGFPVLGQEDEKLFQEAEKMPRAEWSKRQEMLYKLMTDEEK